MRNSAVVIGTSRIALALAERLVGEDWPVVLFGAEGAELGEAEDRLDGEDVRVLALDLADADAVDELFDQAVDAAGPIGLLVVCLPDDLGGALAADALRIGFEVMIAGPLAAIEAARERRGDMLSVVLTGAEETPAAAVLNAAVGALAAALWDQEDRQLRINFLRAGAGSRERQVVDAAMLFATAEAGGINGQSILLGRERREPWSGS